MYAYAYYNACIHMHTVIGDWQHYHVPFAGGEKKINNLTAGPFPGSYLSMRSDNNCPVTGQSCSNHVSPRPRSGAEYQEGQTWE